MLAQNIAKLNLISYKVAKVANLTIWLNLVFHVYLDRQLVVMLSDMGLIQFRFESI